tara:strand:+ start:3806 stop:5344 length:1539 start_codon:yes stop_codon:yes gene_type:complete
MKSLKKYNNGGNVRSLLNSLERQSAVKPIKRPSPAVAESTNRFPRGIQDPRVRMQQERDAAEAFSFEMTDRARKRQEEIKRLGFDPMASGAAESVSPMKFVSPVGDIEDMYQGIKMAYEGVKEGKAGKAALGSGLALGAAALAFVPGNAGMIRSYAQSVNNPMLDRIVKGLSEEGANAEDVIRNVSRDFTQAERQATRDDARQLVDMSFDEFSGLDLSNSERLLLEEIGEVSSTGSPSNVLRSSAQAVEAPPVSMPENIAGFQKRVDNYGDSRMISYTDEAGNYVELNQGDVNEFAQELSQEYGGRTVNSLNMDMTEAIESKSSSQRDQYAIINGIFDEIQSKDLVNIGSLSTDSYPILMRQLKKGEKYLKDGGEKQGAKLLDKVPQNRSISYKPLNDMGKFSSAIVKGLPPNEVRNVIDDLMLTNVGTAKAQGFSSIQEANAYLKKIKENHVDPYLISNGLPPSRLVEHGTFPGATRLDFPYPVVEKLIRGGKLKINKKKKKGMQAKKYYS